MTGRDGSKPVLSIVACCPVDTSELPAIDGAQPPVPSIAHRIVQCHWCGQDVWIGPKQDEVANRAAGPQLVVLCYLCALACLDAAGIEAKDLGLHYLDSRADETPRRT